MTGPATNNTKSKPAIIGMCLAIFALLIALGCAFWVVSLWLEQNKLQLLPIQVTQLIKENTASTMETELSPIKKTLQNQQNQLSQVTQTLKRQAAPVRTAQADWLIQMAQLQLNLQHDPSGTKKLLALAQADLPQNKTTLAKAIAADQQLLSKLPLFPMTATIASLQQLRQATQNLQLPATYSKAQSSDNNTGWWQRRWDGIKNLFVIRRLDDGAARLLTPEQATLLKASITLQLDTATWALLNNNNKLFAQALQNATMAINQGFSHNTTMVSMLQEIHKLQQLKFPNTRVLQLQSFALLANNKAG